MRYVAFDAAIQALIANSIMVPFAASLNQTKITLRLLSSGMWSVLIYGGLVCEGPENSAGRVSIWLPTGAEGAVEVDAKMVDTSFVTGESVDLPMKELVDLLTCYVDGRSELLTGWWEAVRTSESSDLRAVCCIPLISNTSSSIRQNLAHVQFPGAPEHGTVAHLYFRHGHEVPRHRVPIVRAAAVRSRASSPSSRSSSLYLAIGLRSFSRCICDCS